MSLMMNIAITSVLWEHVTDYHRPGDAAWCGQGMLVDSDVFITLVLVTWRGCGSRSGLMCRVMGMCLCLRLCDGLGCDKLPAHMALKQSHHRLTPGFTSLLSPPPRLGHYDDGSRSPQTSLIPISSPSLSPSLLPLFTPSLPPSAMSCPQTTAFLTYPCLLVTSLRILCSESGAGMFIGPQQRDSKYYFCSLRQAGHCGITAREMTGQRVLFNGVFIKSNGCKLDVTFNRNLRDFIVVHFTEN